MATAAMPHDILIKAGTTFPEHDAEAGSLGDMLPQQQQNLRIVALQSQPGGRDSALPSHVLFGALRHPALRLRKAIPLRTERSEQGVSVIWEDGEEFGFGDTFGNAMTDFADTIAELYLYLSDTEALSDDLIAVRNRLSNYIDVRTQ